MIELLCVENIQDTLMHIPVWIRVLWGWCLGAMAGIAWTRFVEVRRLMND